MQLHLAVVFQSQLVISENTKITLGYERSKYSVTITYNEDIQLLALVFANQQMQNE